MSNFKAILFDFDDTLVDSYHARVTAAERAAEGYLDPDIDLERIMKEWAGRPQMGIWMDLSGDEKKAEAMMDGYKNWYWKETTREVTLFPGVREMPDKLKSKGFALGIVTSKARLLHDMDEPYGALVEMQRLGCDDLFDVVVGWGDAHESKPAPAPILFAVDKLGIGIQDAMMVGDSHIDITSAKRAGVTSAGAAWGTLSRELLVQAEPDYILESPSELFSLEL